MPVADRLIAASVEAPQYGRSVVCSAYLWVNQGLSPANLGLLESVGRIVSHYRLPFILAADHNIGPPSLAKCDFMARLHAKAAYPSRATCITKTSRSTIDFFVISEHFWGLRHDTTIEDTTASPHRPAGPKFEPDALTQRMHIIRMPQPIPHTRVVGPLRQQRDWTPICELIDAARSRVGDARVCAESRYLLDRAYEAYTAALEEELMRLTDQPTVAPGRRACPIRVVEVPVFARGEARFKPWRSFAKAWRWIGNRITEIQSILNLTSLDEAEDALGDWITDSLAKPPSIAQEIPAIMDLVRVLSEIVSALANDIKGQHCCGKHGQGRGYFGESRP